MAVPLLSCLWKPHAIFTESAFPEHHSVSNNHLSELGLQICYYGCVLIKHLYHNNPKTILTTATVGEVITYLLQEDINGLIVLDQKGKVKGIISLQDIAGATVPRQFRQNVRMAAAMYRQGFFAEICQQLKDKPVTSIMRKEFISVSLEDNIMAVTADFLKNDLYIVPVIENKTLIGVVTRTEIKKAIADSMRHKETE